MGPCYLESTSLDAMSRGLPLVILTLTDVHFRFIDQQGACVKKLSGKAKLAFAKLSNAIGKVNVIVAPV